MSILEQLKNKQLIWQGFRQVPIKACLATSFSELDKKLGGGLPKQGVIELNTTYGIGELRLLTHYLAQKQQSGLVVFINPPAQLNAEFLLKHSIKLDKVIFIQDVTAIHAHWSAEQCLKSGCCSCILLWSQPVSIKITRRFLLASEQSDASLFLFNQDGLTSHLSTPMTMKMQLSSSSIGLSVKVIKQKAGMPIDTFDIDYRALWPELIARPSKMAFHSPTPDVKQITSH